MEWHEPGNPRPWPAPRPYVPVPWPMGDVISLQPFVPGDEICESFFNLVQRRRTQREFAPLSMNMLGALTSLTCRVQQVGSVGLGFPLTLRPCPSAGAIHPIHLLITRPDENGWYRYDPFSHAICGVPSKLHPQVVRTAMRELVQAPQATLLLLVAEPGMTAAKYEFPESLVWRDAGVMLGILAMAAEALDLAFCPLGVTGEPWVSQLIDQTGLHGVGAAYVGANSP